MRPFRHISRGLKVRRHSKRGGVNALEPGASAFMTLNLEPGEYAAVCLVPDPSTGHSHLDLGMLKRFSVQ
jgi:uncharacterized cupredoxin-like copper-binding protein